MPTKSKIHSFSKYSLSLVLDIYLWNPSVGFLTQDFMKWTSGFADLKIKNESHIKLIMPSWTWGTLYQYGYWRLALHFLWHKILVIIFNQHGWKKSVLFYYSLPYKISLEICAPFFKDLITNLTYSSYTLIPNAIFKYVSIYLIFTENLFFFTIS